MDEEFVFFGVFTLQRFAHVVDQRFHLSKLVLEVEIIRLLLCVHFRTAMKMPDGCMIIENAFKAKNGKNDGYLEHFK